MNQRIDRLRALLDEPLLVSSLVNVRYLTGFSSSNAAVLVEPDRVQLFADFRYSEAGRKVPGVEFTITKRAVAADLARRLSGRIAFEAGSVSYAQYQALAAGGLELVPTHGLVEGLRAVKDEDEIARIRAATEVTNAAFARFAEGRAVGETERDLAWRMTELLHEHGADSFAFPTI
ncbi:MAG: M24 family metallopeptidase, partial [Gaiellaceae bacterium]